MAGERERAYLTPLPKCACGKPATQELRNGVNAKISQHCDRCAGPALERFAEPSSVAAAEGEREIVTAEASLEMLDVIEDYDAGSGPEQCVHTYRQGVAGMLLGAHMPLEKVKTKIAEHGIELAGPVMTGMRHGLVLEDETGAVFLATKAAEA